MGSSLLRRYLATCAALWMLHGISEHSRCSAQSFSALYESDWTNLNASYASFCNMSLNNSFGWDGVAPRLQEPQRTIILESGAWDSARLSTHIVEILIREVLGYKVMVKEYVGGVTTGNRVKYQIVDAAVELWTSDASYYNQMVLYEHSILDAGKSGYTGQIGWCVPNWVVQAYSNYYMDFWRSLRIPAALSIYPRSGMGVHMTINNPPQPTCTGITGGCQNGTYVPSQCINNTHCVEFLSYGPGYTPFYSERLIDGLKLNITVNYMDPARADAYIISQIAARNPILFYCWSPTVLGATQNITRIPFPEDNSDCIANFLNNRANTSVACDYPADLLFKLTTTSLPTTFPYVTSLLQRFSMTNSDVDSMLSALSGGTMSYGDVACNWLQNNEIVWKTWIPSPPVLDVASCGVGMGKYSIGLMTECLSCPVGSYNWQANNTGTCTLCPTNANCAGGTLVVPSENYWLNSLSTTVADIYECPVDGVCCPGGACNITNQCAPGFAGVLCSDCASPEHYMWGGECVTCPNNMPGPSFYNVLLGTLAFVVVLLLIPKGAGPTIEILTFYFQVASLITDRFGIHQVLSVISLNMDVLPKCLVPLSGMFKILFIYASPALMFMNLSWVLGLCWLFSKFAPMRAVEVISKRAPAYLKHHSLAENAIHTSVEVATFCFLPMIEAATTLLDCRTIAGTNVLYQAASTPCWKGMHLGAGIFAIIVITTLLGAVPVSLLVYLRSLKVKRQLVYVTHDTTWHRLLYKPFRKKYYFWLPVALFERGFVLLIFVAFSGTDKFTMNNSRVFLFFVLSIVRMYIQPYRQHAESRLNQEACLCWLVLSSLNYLYLFNWTTNGAVALLDAAMVVVLLLPIVSFVYWRSHRVVQRMKSKGLADDRSAGSHNCLSDDAIATIPSKVRKSQNIEGEA